MVMPFFVSVASAVSEEVWKSSPSIPWFEGLTWAGVVLATLGFSVALWSALYRARQYRALGVHGQSDREEVASALARVELQTSGEIAVVVLERADDHPHANWLSALTFVCIGTLLMSGVMPWDWPVFFLLTQLALGAVGFFLARFLPGWKRLFIFERRAEEMAKEQALQEFAQLGMHRTVRRTGVLVFVSLLEREVVVLADQGIHSKVENEAWVGASDAILERARQGSLKTGLIEGILRIGEILGKHVPPGASDRNEIPNHLIVRDR